MKKIPWTQEDIIIAYALYCVTPLNKIRTNNPIIQKAAEKIGHSVSSLTMRMLNFMSVDPDSDKTGCAHVAKADKEIFENFKHDWFTLSCKAEEYLGFELFYNNDSTTPLSEKLPINGSKPISSLDERNRTNKERNIFRTEIIAAYDGKCCITGVNIPELLIASHIKDFSKSPDFQRIAPTNGLLMNTFHDSLFDKGFITVLPDYTIKLSGTLKKRSDINNEFNKRWIFGIENTKINLPPRFQPDKQCLEWHNKYKFRE